MVVELNRSGREIIVIDEEGNNLGLKHVSEAQVLANTAGLDLIEVGKNDGHLVYKLMDVGRWKYEQKKKSHKNKQHSLPLKELKFRLGIEQHDLDVKLKHVSKFISKGHSVKLVVQLKGREKAKPDSAKLKLLDILAELKEECKQDEIKNTPGQAHVIIHPMPTANKAK